jgi:cysteinyl-tRNA synthetase
MSVAHLGEQIDIHGGGRDLVFPHHENEIAQAECSTGCVPFCGFWMHNGMLELEGVKMSKSLGNLVLARNLMSEVEPDHLRLYLLSTRYRDDANYEHGDLTKLSGRYGRLKAAASAADTAADDEHPLLRAFAGAMDADFDAPGALDVLDEAAGRVVGGVAADGEAVALRRALGVLGFAFAGARGPANGDLNP